MNARLLLLIVAILLAALTLSSCGGDEPAEATSSPADDLTAATNTPVPPPTQEPTPVEDIHGEANVESVQILILESFPVQVSVLARGEHSNGCIEVDEITTERNGNAFDVLITTVAPGDAVCTEALVPFEESISLDVLDLDAGSYSVTVNGISGSFTLQMDNRIPEEGAQESEAEPTATAEPASSASISGRIWHDLCGFSERQPAEGEDSPTGCIIPTGGEAYRADGIMDDGEPGIAGLSVSLIQDACPGEELAVVETGDDGAYQFDGLAAGTYCVFVDALIPQNSDILVPGGWTFPLADVDNVTIEVGEAENVADVNFGWDYQFLPIPEVDQASCLNSIEFVEDVTVPDDTTFSPGETFVKTWRLRNDGTCPWTTQYSLSYVGGDGLGGPETTPLSSAVAPGQAIDLSVSLTAPEAVGTYRDNWQLSNAAGALFGVGGFADEAFWVQIIVEEPVATPVPNSASIGGVLWSDACFLLSDGTPSAGCVESAEGSGVFIADGTLNFSESGIAGVTVSLSNQECPADGVIDASSVVASTATDDSGIYRFTSLDEGSYCVFINAFSDDNVETLIPGDWTWPAPGVGLQGVFLDAGEEELDIDFGWQDR